MTVCTIITSSLYKKSKHFSILTDVLYKKELSLCINLLFLVLSFGFCFFFIEYGWCYLLWIKLLLCLLSPFPYGVGGGGAGPPAWSRAPVLPHSSKAPPGVPAAHIQMGKGLLFFQVSPWSGGKFCSHSSCLPAPRV